jgi:formate-dependent phosphoribosylglycinamide formyltransferase (GAR transformylase)
VNSLDPTSPLVLDLRALGLQQRAGSMVTVDRTVQAPGSMGVALATAENVSEARLRAQQVSSLVKTSV